MIDNDTAIYSAPGTVFFLSIGIASAVIPVHIKEVGDDGYYVAPLFGGPARTVAPKDVHATSSQASEYLEFLDKRHGTEAYREEVAENNDPLDDMPAPDTSHGRVRSRKMFANETRSSAEMNASYTARDTGDLIEASTISPMSLIADMAISEQRAFIYYMITRHPANAAKAFRAVYAGRARDRM